MPPTAVVLAGGRGTRLRAHLAAGPTPASYLSAAQENAADTGIKALMPIQQTTPDGNPLTTPFIGYSLSAMVTAGIKRVCFVIRPGVKHPHTIFPKHPAIEISFAVQEQARGTADAVASAEEAIGESDFLVLNSDTYYPSLLLKGLVQASGPALIALDGYAVAKNPASNLTVEQMAGWASLTLTTDGDLAEVLPPPQGAPAAPWWVSINAWRFDSRIFAACQALAREKTHENAELELPRAVQWSRSTLGLRYRVVHSSAPILDLTSRADVPDLERLLPPAQSLGLAECFPNNNSSLTKEPQWP